MTRKTPIAQAHKMGEVGDGKNIGGTAVHDGGYSWLTIHGELPTSKRLT